MPSRDLALPCRLKPSPRSSCATVSGPITWPSRVSSSASTRVELVVQRNGDIGSPRCDTAQLATIIAPILHGTEPPAHSPARRLG